MGGELFRKLIKIAKCKTWTFCDDDVRRAFCEDDKKTVNTNVFYK